MKIKYIYIILFITAITGLSIVQYQYFRIGLNLAGVQFSEKVGASIDEIKEGLTYKNELSFLVGTAITKKDDNFTLSMDSLQDASLYFLDQYIGQKLLENGIHASYGYNIYARDSTLFLQSNSNFSDQEKLLKYPIVLEGYLPEVMKKSLILELQFQNINRYFLTQLNGLTIPSIIFLVMIIVLILFVYRSFYLQHNLIVTTNEFINNLTHELKTPVFSIGLATKILEEKGHDDQKQVIGLIRAQLDKLKGQIDKVLELGMIEQKKGFVKLAEIDLSPVLQNVVRDFEHQATLNNFSFESSIGEGPLIVHGDASHLENALNGLLENAIKYSKAPVSIKLMAFKNEKRLVIQVMDNGVGIDAKDLKKIFEKYYRVADGDRHDVKGYGLGLHYVKRIVHLHKGTIKAESRMGAGTTFTMTLPLKVYDE